MGPMDNEMQFDYPYLEDYFGSTRLLLDSLPEQHERWSAFNPSIGSDGAGNLAITVRSSNYRIDKDFGIPDVELSQIRNKLWFSELDSDLKLVNLREISVVGLAHKPGVEDARLFWRDGEWFIVAATLDTVAVNRRSRLSLFSLNTDESTATYIKTYGSWDANRSEKNWMPLAYGHTDEFDYIYSSSGVYRQGTFILFEENDRAVSNFRGGSCLLPLDDGTYLAVIHQTYARSHQTFDMENQQMIASSIRNYTHRFVRYSQTGMAIEHSPEFYFDGPGIEFAAGMALVGEKLVISYGREDSTAHLATIPLVAVLDLLTPSKDDDDI
jgi:hypothetical protein